MESAARPLLPETRWLLWVFAALALVAGFLLFVLSGQTDRSFSWTIEPPLTAAFLGASFWAACALFVWTARQGLWERAKPALPPVCTIAVLLLAATLIHADRFHRDLFGWFWISAYALVPLLLAAVVSRQLRLPGSERSGAERAPLPGALRGLLAAQGIVMLAVGAALFLAPAGADGLWPWSLTPLTARALASFTLGFGIAALYAVGQNATTRFAGAALAYTALGALQLVAVARYSGELTGSELHADLYTGFLVSVLAGGLYGCLHVRRVRLRER